MYTYYTILYTASVPWKMFSLFSLIYNLGLEQELGQNNLPIVTVGGGNTFRAHFPRGNISQGLIINNC
jgi:hypothetical protein